MGNIEQFNKSTSDSINLTELEGKPFTITAVEDSPYTKDGESTPGVKMTTLEEWERTDGKKVNKIHTTRVAVVSKCMDADFRKALDEGDTFKVKCPVEKIKSKSGSNSYYDLVSA